MKIRELIEAPIADIDVIGSPGTDPGYGHLGTHDPITKRDAGPVQSSKGLKKIKNMYRNVPYDFNFYLVFEKVEKEKARAEVLTPEKLEAINNLIAEGEVKLNELVKRTFDSIKGRILMW